MKKLILLGLLAAFSLLIIGCEELTKEENEILGEDGTLAGRAGYDKARLLECKANTACWSSLMDCYTANCQASPNQMTCANNCLDQATAEGATENDNIGSCPGIEATLNVGETGQFTMEGTVYTIIVYAVESDDGAEEEVYFGVNDDTYILKAEEYSTLGDEGGFVTLMEIIHPAEEVVGAKLCLGGGEAVTDGEETTTTAEELSCRTAAESCDVISTLKVGESMSFTWRGTNYAITNTAMRSSGGEIEAHFEVNGDSTLFLARNTGFPRAGISISVIDYLYQDYAGGIQEATFCFKHTG